MPYFAPLDWEGYTLPLLHHLTIGRVMMNLIEEYDQGLERDIKSLEQYINQDEESAKIPFEGGFWQIQDVQVAIPYEPGRTYALRGGFQVGIQCSHLGVSFLFPFSIGHKGYQA